MFNLFVSVIAQTIGFMSKTPSNHDVILGVQAFPSGPLESYMNTNAMLSVGTSKLCDIVHHLCIICLLRLSSLAVINHMHYQRFSLSFYGFQDGFILK